MLAGRKANLLRAITEKRLARLQGGPTRWRPKNIIVLGGEEPSRAERLRTFLNSKVTGKQSTFRRASVARVHASPKTAHAGVLTSAQHEQIVNGAGRGRLPLWTIALWGYFALWILCWF